MAAIPVKYLISYDRHILEFELPGENKGLTAQQALYPGSTIVTVADAKGARVGMVLNVDGTVSREADNYIHETVDMRLEAFDRWAFGTYNAALRHASGNGNNSRASRTRVQNSSRIIQGFVYNILLVAHNVENRKDNARWATLKNSMQDWITIGNNISTPQVSSLNSSVQKFFSVDSVYVLVTGIIVEARFKNPGGRPDTIDTNLTSATAPLFGLAASHAHVRSVLEIPYQD